MEEIPMKNSNSELLTKQLANCNSEGKSDWLKIFLR